MRKLLVVGFCLVCVPVFAQRVDDAQAVAAIENDKSRGHVDRTWYVDAGSILSLIIHNTYKDSVGANSKNSKQILSFSGGKNFGKYEVGPTFYYSNYSNGTSKIKELDLGVDLTYNFIENKQGNNLIPFGTLHVESAKYTESGSSNYHYDATVYNVIAGVKYFPFGEILALRGKVTYRFLDGKYDGSTDYNFERSGFRVDGEIYIYF